MGAAPTTCTLPFPGWTWRGTTTEALKVPSDLACTEPTTTGRGAASTILILAPARNPTPERLTCWPATALAGADKAGVATITAGAGRVVTGATVTGSWVVAVVAGSDDTGPEVLVVRWRAWVVLDVRAVVVDRAAVVVVVAGDVVAAGKAVVVRVLFCAELP